ncbi:GLPGLI family protein [Psychroserpens sp. SPM9]|uniref:GLPGLI family protein n=1 Tax=Psychroserpens sp. SPM9 TaxID=2975598 RepID=UPI0021A3EF64|nr:GLPGLI family protein [Psychroserpens sp. SPM9]MDG5493012.1 GLPGLI family protein [Psychroserpens sp. SPM9]
MKIKHRLFLLNILIFSICIGQEDKKSNLFIEYNITYNLGKKLTKKGYLFKFKGDKYFFTTKSDFKDKLEDSHYDSIGNHRFINLKSAGNGRQYELTSINKSLHFESRVIGNMIVKTKEELLKMKWRETDIEKTIMNQKCRLYETEFRGRTYNAYVALELKYDFGPWKFNGFKGVPMLIYDSENKLKWELSSIKNYDSEQLLSFAQNVIQELNSLREMNLTDFVELSDQTKGGMYLAKNYPNLPSDFQKSKNEDEPVRKGLELIYEWEK